MPAILPDSLRHAARRLRRSPAFAMAVAGTLALAIAAAATVFAVYDAVLLRDLPYADPDRLVLVWQRTDASPSDRLRLAAPDVDRIARAATSFEDLAFVVDARDAVLEAGDGAVHLRVGPVSTNLFKVLGVTASPGRVFAPGDGLLPPGGPPDGVPPPPGVLVLSHELWRSRYGADPGVVGRLLRIDGADLVITGVAPPSFQLYLPPDAGIDTDVDAWIGLRVPLAGLRRTQGLRDQDSDNTGAVVGRLRPGASVAQATLEMRSIGTRLREETPALAEAGARLAVAPMHADVTEHVRPALLAVLVAVLLAVLVASLNASGLLVARAIDRRREMAVRAALGAAPGRIVGLVVAECVILGVAAGATGLVLTQWGVDLVRTVAPATVARIDAGALNGTLLVFTAAIVALTILISASASILALPLHVDTEALRGRGSRAHGRGRLRRLIVIGQVAVSLALLVGAGLLVRSFASLSSVQPGFQPQGLLTFEIAMPGPSIGGPAQRSALMRDIADGIAGLPAVVAVGLTGGLPLSGERFTQPVGFDGEDPDAWNRRQANFRVVSSDYFTAIGTRIVAGRAFTREEDLTENARVAIVDRRLAGRVAGDGNAVGHWIHLPLDGRRVRAEIVGVAENVRFEDLDAPGRPTVYVPYRQEASRQVGFAVRTTGDPARLEPTIRNLLSTRDEARDLPVWDFRPMYDFVRAETAPVRFALVVTAAFGGIALLLTMFSLYTLIAWITADRRAEIGVRIALGARPADVIRQFTATGVRLTVLGLAAGVVLTVVLSGAISELLYGVGPADLAVLITVVALLMTAAVLASLIPARAAAARDPTAVLGAD